MATTLLPGYGNDTTNSVYNNVYDSMDVQQNMSYNYQNDTVLTLIPYSWPHLIATSIVLGMIILGTIIGNVFVIAAIILEKNLQNVANYLILSLALADLMIAALVMPLAAVNEVSTQWFLGDEICDFFISFDVICCTSSILHLVAIAMDRYWAVTQIDYITNRSGKRILIMIASSWIISVMISIPPLFGWKDTGPSKDPAFCLISQDWYYTVYSTSLAFYLPLILLLIIYLKIFKAARSRIRRKNFKSYTCKLPNGDGNPKPLLKDSGNQTDLCVESNGGVHLAKHNSSNGSIDPEKDSNRNNKLSLVDSSATTPPPSPAIIGKSQQRASLLNLNQEDRSASKASISPKQKDKKEKIEQKRERKAARTLGIITGTFICCWLPFFIVALVRPFCGDKCSYPAVLMSAIGWIGYFNSLLNPIIYTIFNPDFRMAFRKILFGKYHGVKDNRMGRWR